MSAASPAASSIFDDIDFTRLHEFVNANRAGLQTSLGSRGMRNLRSAIDNGERASKEWNRSEARIVGKTIRATYALFNWKAVARWSRGLLASSDRQAQSLLGQGLDRWRAEVIEIRGIQKHSKTLARKPLRIVVLCDSFMGNYLIFQNANARLPPAWLNCILLLL